MRNSVYAILAVVVGVMLVGMLPGQLSNLAAPAPARTGLQTGGAESTPNVTTTGDTYYDIVNGTIPHFLVTGNITLDSKSAATAAAEAQAKADAAEAASAAGSDTVTYSFGATTERSDPYADLVYYGMWGVGLFAALAVYLASKRMLG
jgi:hypothetical protein